MKNIHLLFCYYHVDNELEGHFTFTSTLMVSEEYQYWFKSSFSICLCGTILLLQARGQCSAWQQRMYLAKKRFPSSILQHAEACDAIASAMA